jgi:hypothetical protein
VARGVVAGAKAASIWHGSVANYARVISCERRVTTIELLGLGVFLTQSRI